MNAATRALAASTLDGASAFIGMCDTQFRPAYLNPSGRSMVNFPATSELTQVKVSDFFVPEHRKLIDVVGLPTMAREGRWEQELRFRDWMDPAHELDVRCSIFGLYDERRRFLAGVTITQEIRSRNKADKVFREGRALVDAVLEKLPLGVGVFDASGRLLHSNEGWRRRGVFSLPARASSTRTQWKGMVERQAVTPEDPGARALRGESVAAEDMLCSADDAPPNWVRVSASPIGNKRDAPGGAVVVVEDIEELRRTKMHLACAEARLSVAAEVAGVGIFNFDPATGTLAWDERQRQLWGLRSEDTADWQTFEGGIHPDDVTRVRAAIGHLMSAGRAQQSTLRYRIVRRHDGELRHIVTTVRAVFEGVEMTAMIGASIDLSATASPAVAVDGDTSHGAARTSA